MQEGCLGVVLAKVSCLLTILLAIHVRYSLVGYNIILVNLDYIPR